MGLNFLSRKKKFIIYQEPLDNFFTVFKCINPFKTKVKVEFMPSINSNIMVLKMKESDFGAFKDKLAKQGFGLEIVDSSPVYYNLVKLEDLERKKNEIDCEI